MTDPSWKPDFETLSAYLDGELPPVEMARVEAYVKVHPEAQKELDELRALEGRVAAPVPGEAELDLDPFTRKLWGEVDRHRERSKGFGGFPLRFAWVPLAAAAAIVIVMRSNLHRPEVMPRRAAVTQSARPAPAAPKDTTGARAAGAAVPGPAASEQSGPVPSRDEAPAMSPPVQAVAPQGERKQENQPAAGRAGDGLLQKNVQMKAEEPASERTLAEVRVAPPPAAGAPTPEAAPRAPAGPAKASPVPSTVEERPVDNLVQPVGTLAGSSSTGSARALGAARADAAKASAETLEGFLRRVGSSLEKSKKESRLGTLGGLTHKTGIMRPRQIDSTSGALNEGAQTGNAPKVAAQEEAHTATPDTLTILAATADASLADGRTLDAQEALDWMIRRYSDAPPTPHTAYGVELALRGVNDPLARDSWEPGDDLARWTGAIGSWRAFAIRWKTPEGWAAAGVSLALQYRQSGDAALCRQARECFSRALDASPTPAVARRVGALRKKYAGCVVE